MRALVVALALMVSIPWAHAFDSKHSVLAVYHSEILRLWNSNQPEEASQQLDRLMEFSLRKFPAPGEDPVVRRELVEIIGAQTRKFRRAELISHVLANPQRHDQSIIPAAHVADLVLVNHMCVDLQVLAHGHAFVQTFAPDGIRCK